MDQKNAGLIIGLMASISALALLVVNTVFLGAELSTWLVLRYALISTSIFAVTIPFGLYSAEKLGLSIIPVSAVAPVIMAAYIINRIVEAEARIRFTELADSFKLPFENPVLTFWGSSFVVDLLISVGLSIALGIIFRLFFVSCLAWVLTKFSLPKNTCTLIAVIAVPIMLGLALVWLVPQIPAVAALVPADQLDNLTSYLLMTVIPQGIVLGWLYTRYSLTMSLAAHFLALTSPANSILATTSMVIIRSLLL